MSGKPLRKKLTKAVVDRARYEASTPNARCVVWDTELRGFGLRIQPSGMKAFVVSYRSPDGGRKRLMTLGAYGALTVDEARKRARKTLGLVADGVDPLQERQESRKRRTTVRDYMTRWLEAGGRQGSASSFKEDKRRLESHVLPALGSKHLADLVRRDMKRLHLKVTKRGPVEANRTLELVRAILNEAKREELIVENPASGSWKSLKGPGNRERSRTRHLRPSEFEAFAKAVEAEEDPYVRAAVWLLLLTGARSASELLRLRWADVDFDRGMLTFRQTKTDAENPLPMSASARSILEELPRQHGNPYVFPSPRVEGEHRRTIRKPWGAIRKAAGVEDLTLHDLRRSAGTFMAAAGVPLLHIGQVLGHKSEDVTKVYTRILGDETRAAVDILGARVEELRRSATGTEIGEDAREAEIIALRARLAELEGAIPQ